MLRSKALLLFLVKFLLIYFIAVTPLLPLSTMYTRMMRNLASEFFHTFRETGEIRFKKNKDPKFDTRIVVINKAIDVADDSPGEVGKDYSLYIGGFIPLALVTGLIFASQVPWRRRIFVWLISFIVVDFFLMIKIWFVAIVIIHRFPDLGFPLRSNYSQETRDNIIYFVSNPHPSYILCVLLWLSVTFRKEDWNKVILYSRKRLLKVS